uniref:Uncharacterized protein n=1 Tax=Arundo donax TaxID=35708 RepID=A0A0A9BEB5_ARUDO
MACIGLDLFLFGDFSSMYFQPSVSKSSCTSTTALPKSSCNFSIVIS